MKRILVLIALLFTFFALAPAVSALDPLHKACTAGGSSSQSAACLGNTDGDPSGPNGVIYRATKIVAAIAGIAAVILIIIAGFNYVTSDGDASKIAAAKSCLIGALVGIVIISVAQGLLTFVLTKV